VDIFGNAIFVASIVSALIALTWGGTVFNWETFHIVVPFVLGFLGLILFTAFEWTPRLCPEPSFPREVVSNRTSAAALLLTFIHAIVTYWTYYFLPIYFQSVKGASPLESGVDTLPTFAGSLFFGVLGGFALARTGRYKPLHIIGFGIMVVSFGLFWLLDAHSSTAAWVCFQLLCASGSGLLGGILLTAVQAPLEESLVATATGLWSFSRYFGCVWGITIPSVIFNNECSRLAHLVNQADIAEVLESGRAYRFATRAFLDSIADSTVRDEVVQVFTKALRLVWLVGIAFAGLGFLTTLLEKEIELRSALNSDFGMEQRKMYSSGDEVGTPRRRVRSET